MTADAAPAPNVQPKAKIFISYSRKDMAFADRLDAALKARGFEPLIDRTEIYAFEDWWKRLQALIARADTVVFVLSPDAVASEGAQGNRLRASLNKRFAPIVCRRVDDGDTRSVTAAELHLFRRSRPIRGEPRSARRGATNRYRLDQEAHRVRRSGAAMVRGGPARRSAAAFAGAGRRRTLDRVTPARTLRRRPKRPRLLLPTAAAARRGGGTS